MLVVVSILYVSQISVEGFQALTYPTPEIVIPKTSPPREVLTAGNFKGFAAPSFTLLAPPPGGIASVNTLPYRDPALEKAPFARIKNVLETANGFVKVEAPKMREMSDPTIQLPLTTLRSDIRRLSDEVAVLSRNPGIDSSLTQKDVDDIEANLAFLQKKWRASANSVSGAVEGFQTEQRKASLSQLKDLQMRIATEMTRLSSSGTTDPVVSNRINTLRSIKSAVDSIVTRVENRTLKEVDIPILENDYASFLPALSSPGSALPQLLKDNNLSPSLANLFPAYQAGDISGANLGQYLLQTYGDTFFKGLSWDMRLNYTGERVKDIAQAKRDFAISAAQALKAQADAKMYGQEDTTSSYGSAEGKPTVPSQHEEAPSVDYRGEFSAKTESGTANLVPGAPGTLDWKTRSKEICEAIRKRGYEPGDFGCLADDAEVGKDFSWRGYARMVCARLGTIYDTGAPEACGCPPPTWPGWRP